MHFSVTTTPQAGARKWSYSTFSPQTLCLGSLRTYNSVPMWIKSQHYTSLIWVNLFYSPCSYMIFLYWIALCILCNCTFIDQWPYYGIIYQTPSYDSKNIFYSAHTWPWPSQGSKYRKAHASPSSKILTVANHLALYLPLRLSYPSTWFLKSLPYWNLSNCYPTSSPFSMFCICSTEF